ncbi:MAG: TaqI-like C-terminal specificity domain-containing protein [Deferribacterota bacterium]|nr:TaqI-like C-terminal specificity domain-containing protein [Deferribacterota bacterium]
MFGVTDGFDVVIANPPYVKEYVNRSAFDGLRDSPYYQGKMDLWYMFACKGIDMLKQNGILTFIAQNNWVTSYGASKMRNKVIQDTQILSLIDFGAYRIFEAGIQTMVIILKKSTNLENYFFDYRKLISNDAEINDVVMILNKESSAKTEYLTLKIQRSKFINKALTFSASNVQNILEKILGKSNFFLDPQKEVAQGIVCPQEYLNKASQKILGEDFEIGEGIFTLTTQELKALQLSKAELRLIKPFFTTKELNRWKANPHNQKWIIYTDSSFKDKKIVERYPNIKKHLDRFKKVITSDNKPYGLHRARDEFFFKGEKIIVVRKCARPTFIYVDFDSYVSATFYIIKTERINQKYLVGVLNSRLIEFWLRHKGKMQGTNYQIDKEPLVNIPLIKANENTQGAIASVVDKILAITKDEDYLENPDKQAKVHEYEKQIDQLVYKLYGLTEEEIKIIEEQKY